MGGQAHFNLTTEKAFPPPLPEDRDMVILLGVTLLECCTSVFLRQDRKTTNKQTNKQTNNTVIYLQFEINKLIYEGAYLNWLYKNINVLLHYQLFLN